MPDIKGLEGTFDTVASAYARMRPGYVEELYQRIFEYLPIDTSSRVLEIGIGGGQASLPILRTGCKYDAVEYGAHFSELCREKFKEYPNFAVITGKFEDVDLKPDSFDLIFSASAFHWVPEGKGYPKVYSLLKEGGAFARFANHPFEDKGRREMSDEIQRLYAVYMNSVSRPVEYSREMAADRAGLAEKYGFSDIAWEVYHRTRTFSAEEYVALLGTYSDHIALEEGRRKEFFSRIEQTINRYGGEITLYDTLDLQLARKPGRNFDV